MDLSPTTKNIEFGHIKPKTTTVFLTACLGDTTISFGFRKDFHTHRIALETRNKAKIKKISPLSASFFFFIAAVTDKKTPANGLGRN